MRNSIQKTKIDMANEVIDAGRFDMSTTQEERKETLEALLQVLAFCLPASLWREILDLFVACCTCRAWTLVIQIEQTIQQNDCIKG